MRSTHVGVSSIYRSYVFVYQWHSVYDPDYGSTKECGFGIAWTNIVVLNKDVVYTQLIWHSMYTSFAYRLHSEEEAVPNQMQRSPAYTT